MPNAPHKKLLVTGGNGFIGGAVLRALAGLNLSVRAISRQVPAPTNRDVEWIVGDLDDFPGLAPALRGVDTVLHLAGHAGNGSDEQLLRANRDMTERLAEQSAVAGVGRFVYISSVRVYGNAPYIDENTPAAPVDAYGRSKLAGEEALIGVSGAMKYSIVRSPLVYGEGRGGLIRILVAAARYGLPMPLKGLTNRRSMISSSNLASLLVAAALADDSVGSFRLPAAESGGWTYDAILHELAALQGRTHRSIHVPRGLLGLVVRSLMSSQAVDRMLADCVVDPSALCALLDWKPLLSPPDSFRLML